MNYHLARPSRLPGPLSGYLRRAPLNTQPTRALRKFIHGPPPRWFPPTPRITRLNAIFLLSVGLCTAGYLVSKVYDRLTSWPPEVRHDLRSGLRAKYKGDLETSESYLQRAWTTAKSVPISLFASEPYLKISGIAVYLASVLEDNHKMERAFQVYEEALEKLSDEWGSLNGKEKLRAIGIVCKLGAMADQMEGKEEQEERYFVWAAKVLTNDFKNEELMGPGRKEKRTLPHWVNRVEFATPFEMLASFYARTRRTEKAMIVYLIAITVLIDTFPGVEHPSAEEYCKAAQLMTGVSELHMRNPASRPSSEIFREAELWNRRALDISGHYLEPKGEQYPTCQAALAAAAYNIGIIKKMAGDKEDSEPYFELSLVALELLGSQEGIQKVEKALSTIDEEIGRE